MQYPYLQVDSKPWIDERQLKAVIFAARASTLSVTIEVNFRFCRIASDKDIDNVKFATATPKPMEWILCCMQQRRYRLPTSRSSQMALNRCAAALPVVSNRAFPGSSLAPGRPAGISINTVWTICESLLHSILSVRLFQSTL